MLVNKLLMHSLHCLLYLGYGISCLYPMHYLVILCDFCVLWRAMAFCASYLNLKLGLKYFMTFTASNWFFWKKKYIFLVLFNFGGHWPDRVSFIFVDNGYMAVHQILISVLGFMTSCWVNPLLFTRCLCSM